MFEPVTSLAKLPSLGFGHFILKKSSGKGLLVTLGPADRWKMEGRVGGLQPEPKEEEQEL